jgi:glycosyltransferase involved in cell wall biosynthesis
MTFVPVDSQDQPEVSVIIPLHRDNPRFRVCLHRCMSMPTTVAFEVVVVSDRLPTDLPATVVQIATGSPSDSSPAVKRDVAAAVARGGIFAYLDDDAYPAPDWLDQGVAILSGGSVEAVGGPGVTPPGSPWRERLGGAVYESRLGSSALRYRFWPIWPPRDVDDMPAYNLLVRRTALEGVGGWQSTFYGGEDTKLCMALVERGLNLRYDPLVLVHHFRRPVFKAHMRQVANVGRHRGYFMRLYPQTSRKPIYLLPTVFTVALAPLSYLLGKAALRSPRRGGATVASGWLVLSAFAMRKAGAAALLFPAALACHHVAYGVSMLRGLFGRPIEF